MARKTKSTKKIWDEFGQFIFEPYSQNPESLKNKEAWFGDLYARHKNGEEFALKKCVFYIPVSDKTISTYSIKDQIFFSHNPGVLSIPHPQERKEMEPGQVLNGSKFVGIWLHDFGPTPDLAKIKNNKKYKYWMGQIISLNAQQLNHPGIKSLTNEIVKNLGAEGRSEVPSNQIRDMRHKTIQDLYQDMIASIQGHVGYMPCKLRLSHRSYKSSGHMDFDFTHFADRSWGRSLIYSIRGEGTGYYLGDNKRDDESLISCPTGAVSSHVFIEKRHSDLRSDTEYAEIAGVKHISGGEDLSQGRDVLIMMTKREKLFSPCPWRLKQPVF